MNVESCNVDDPQRRIIWRLIFRSQLPLATGRWPSAVNVQLLARAYVLIARLGWLATVVVRWTVLDYRKAGCPVELCEYAAARDFWLAIHQPSIE